MNPKLATITIALGPILTEQQLLKLAEIAQRQHTTLDAVVVQAVDSFVSRHNLGKATEAILPA